MYIIWNKLRALIDWLTAVETVADSNPATCWADLPTYHPDRD